jgi:hypothetical protein
MNKLFFLLWITSTIISSGGYEWTFAQLGKLAKLPSDAQICAKDWKVEDWKNRIRQMLDKPCTDWQRVDYAFDPKHGTAACVVQVGSSQYQIICSKSD